MEASRAFDRRSDPADIEASALVFHSQRGHSQRGDIVPFNEGRLIAVVIRHATLVPVASRNHLVLEPEPAWARSSERAPVPPVAAVRMFLSSISPKPPHD